MLIYKSVNFESLFKNVLIELEVVWVRIVLKLVVINLV